MRCVIAKDIFPIFIKNEINAIVVAVQLFAYPENVFMCQRGFYPVFQKAVQLKA